MLACAATAWGAPGPRAREAVKRGHGAEHAVSGERCRRRRRRRRCCFCFGPAVPWRKRQGGRGGQGAGHAAPGPEPQAGKGPAGSGFERLRRSSPPAFFFCFPFLLFFCCSFFFLKKKGGGGEWASARPVPSKVHGCIPAGPTCMHLRFACPLGACWFFVLSDCTMPCGLDGIGAILRTAAHLPLPPCSSYGRPICEM